MLFYNEIMKSPMFGFVSKVKAAINYWRYTIGIPIYRRKDKLQPIWWSILLFPFAYYYFVKDKLV